MSDPFASLLSSFKGGEGSKNRSETKKNDLSMDRLLSSSRATSGSNIDLIDKKENIDHSVKNNIDDDMAELFGVPAPVSQNVSQAPLPTQNFDDLDAAFAQFNLKRETKKSSTSGDGTNFISNDALPIDEFIDDFIVDEVKDMEIAKLMSLGLSIEEALKSYDQGQLYNDVRASSTKQAPHASKTVNRAKVDPLIRDRSTSRDSSFSLGNLLGKSKDFVDSWAVNHDEDNRLFRNTDFKRRSNSRLSNASSNRVRGNSVASFENPFEVSNYERLEELASEDIDFDLEYKSEPTDTQPIKVKSTNIQRHKLDLTSNDQIVLLGDVKDNFTADESNNAQSSADSTPFDDSNYKNNRLTEQEDVLLDFAAPANTVTSTKSINDSISSVFSVPISQIELSGYNEFKDNGTASFKNGDYVSATLEYEKSLNTLPHKHGLRIIAYSNMFASLLKVGEYKKIVDLSTSALELFPEDSKAWNSTIQNSTPARSYREIWPKIFLRRAEAFEHLENHEMALNCYQTLIENNIFEDKIMAGKRRCQKVLNPVQVSKPVSSQKANSPIKSSVAKTQSSTTNNENLRRVQESNKRELQIEQQKVALYDKVESKINQWKANKDNDIRHLLANLHTILTWVDWKSVNSSDLVMPKKVKMTYLRAVAKTHPDKLSSSLDLELQMIAENVFATLSKAWELFKKENNIN